MQRTGRKGHAMFRVVVQDSRRTPTSGKVVALLGSYDPHGKAASLQKDKAQFYLDHGAQPSGRVVKLLENEGVKLPVWVKKSIAKERAVRNPDKLRKHQPVDQAVDNKDNSEPTSIPAAEEAAPAESTEKVPEAVSPADDTEKSSSSEE
jgi:small subunit ribosomal protein S16